MVWLCITEGDRRNINTLKILSLLSHIIIIPGQWDSLTVSWETAKNMWLSSFWCWLQAETTVRIPKCMLTPSFPSLGHFCHQWIARDVCLVVHFLYTSTSFGTKHLLPCFKCYLFFEDSPGFHLCIQHWIPVCKFELAFLPGLPATSSNAMYQNWNVFFLPKPNVPYNMPISFIQSPTKA